MKGSVHWVHGLDMLKASTLLLQDRLAATPSSFALPPSVGHRLHRQSRGQMLERFPIGVTEPNRLGELLASRKVTLGGWCAQRFEAGLLRADAISTPALAPPEASEPAIIPIFT